MASPTGPVSTEAKSLDPESTAARRASVFLTTM